jgi:acyl-CoA dehydrogenase
MHPSRVTLRPKVRRPIAWDSTPQQRTAFYANAAKYLGAELGMKAVDTAIQTLGGRGFDESFGLIPLLEAVRLAKSAPVSSEMILNFVAEHTLGLPRSY